MKISFRIFLGFAAILAVGFYFLISWVIRDVNIQPKKSMEESLVDIAHILAAFLEENTRDRELPTLEENPDWEFPPLEENTSKENPSDQEIPTDSLNAFLDRAGKHRFLAQIFEMEKRHINLEVYVTDKKGIVIFDSHNGESVGKDFSRMRDVYLTLRGKYGARTSRGTPHDPLSSVAYVAAPIKKGEEIIGVCTVAKAWDSINTFIESTREKILWAGMVGFGIALVLSFFISRWITRPIRRLTAYSDSVKEGERPPFPNLGKGEIKELGDSFESMRVSLEGKKYIEKYIQTLTHQLKGPLSAIRGAAELLREDLPDMDRKRFISNIDTESDRLLRIVERMLELSAIEQQKELRHVETIDLGLLVKDIIDEMAVPLKRKEIILLLQVGKGFCFKGERFLIQQAVINLLNNAVEFTPQGGTISVEINEHWNRLFLIIRDSGPGIPDYALDKVFDKFYSLPRPDTGKKSSGLGLSLVKEVANLHRGTITLKNSKPPGTGAVVVLKLPMG